MQPAIFQINNLVSPFAITSSIVPATIGSTGTSNLPFTYNLPALKKIYWEMFGLFTLGATGGFRFLAHSSVAPTTYMTQWTINDFTTPTQFGTNQVAEAAFANASAVATTYAVKAFGSLTAAATATVFSLQFAQNTSDVLTANILAGTTFKLWIE